jgi:integrase
MNNIYKETNSTYTVQFSYKDQLGQARRRKKRGFKTLQDAKKYLVTQENLKYEGKLGIQKYDCLEVLNKYLDELKYQTKISTYLKKKHIYQKYFEQQINGLTIDTIDNRFVLRYKEYLRNLDLHNNHKNTIYSAVSSYMNFAVKYGFSSTNPFRYLNDFTRTKREQTIWTMDHLKQFISESHNPALNTMVWVLFMTGMRKGEYRALTWNDIDFTNQLIRINKTRSFISGIGYQTTSPKTNSSVREVLIDSYTLEVLKNYKQYCSSYYGFTEEDKILFVNAEELSNETLRRNFKKIITRLKLPNIRIHDLRHSHATMLFRTEISPLLISKRIGHKDVQTTMNIYTHVTNTDYKKLISNLEETIKIG